MQVIKVKLVTTILIAAFAPLMTSDVIHLGGSHLFTPFFFNANYDPLLNPQPAQQFPTTSQLPEIIVNRDSRPFDPRSNRQGGYFVQRPSVPFNPAAPPVQADVPFPTSQPSNGYLPPEEPIRDPPDPIPTRNPPPLRDPVSTQESFQDSFTSQEPTRDYLPPQRDLIPDPPPSQPSFDYLPPTSPSTQLPLQNDEGSYQYDPPNSYLPPASGPIPARSSKDLDFFRSTYNSLNGMKMELKDMKCLTNPNGYFKAQFFMHNNIDTFPVIEQDTGDPRCEIKTARSQSFVDIVSEDFQRCGVYSCGGGDLCLKVRFPQIRGLKTSNDLALTLQCKLPERVVAKTHSIRVGVANNPTARTLGTVARGGGNNVFVSQVGLFRRGTENQFTRALQAGGNVQLGEELMLRAQVRAGDGWNFTRVSDIVLQRFSAQGDVLNSVNLVTSNGCVNPQMRNICPLEPVLDPPLGYRFGFKAFMFQGMRSGDEVVMSVKMTGCLYWRDCQLVSD